MSYLYGDSTPSGLNRNYIAFLQDFLVFASGLLQGEARVASAKLKVNQLNTMGHVERERLSSLLQMIESTLADAAKIIPEKTPSFEASRSIRKSTESALKKAESKLVKSLAIAKKDCSDIVMSERSQHVKLFETFLQKHPLPETSHYADIRFDETRSTYTAKQTSHSETGFDSIFKIRLEHFPIFQKPLVVKGFMDKLEIGSPETSGLVRKSTKIRSHSLVNKIIMSITTNATSISYSLRDQAQSDEAGFDVKVMREGNRVKIQRISKGAEEAMSFEASIDDAPQLATLAHRLEEATSSLYRGRGSLIDARLDGHQIKGMDDPKRVVERIIERISPIVRAIGERSLAPDELVLKKIMEDHKREEIYASKKELLAIIEPVSADLRHVFKPLGIEIGPQNSRARRLSLVSSPQSVDDRDPHTQDVPSQDVLSEESIDLDADTEHSFKSKTTVVPTPPGGISSRDFPTPVGGAIDPDESLTPAGGAMDPNEDLTLADERSNHEKVSTEDIIIHEATPPPDEIPLASSKSGQMDDDNSSEDDSIDEALNELHAEEV